MRSHLRIQILIQWRFPKKRPPPIHPFPQKSPLIPLHSPGSSLDLAGRPLTFGSQFASAALHCFPNAER
jgi:hypothetical protein